MRKSDRREARALLIVIFLSLAATPVAAAAGSAVQDNRVQTFAAERLARHQVAALATADSTPANVGYSKYQVTPVRWNFAHDAHADQLLTTFTVKAGEPQTIWINSDGDQVEAPRGEQDAAIEAAVAALALWLVVTGAGVGAWLILRCRLDRCRYADWDKDLDDLADDGRANHKD
ncbi:MAG: hypothetical protein ABWY93_05300 [Mycobacterium sp.]